MHDVLEDMGIDLELRGLLDNTVKTYLRYAGKFVDEIGIPLDQVTATLHPHGATPFAGTWGQGSGLFDRA